jgi:hypothetical protein
MVRIERKGTKENVALKTLARCQLTYDKIEKKKKYFEDCRKQDGVIWYSWCSKRFSVLSSLDALSTLSLSAFLAF